MRGKCHFMHARQQCNQNSRSIMANAQQEVLQWWCHVGTEWFGAFVLFLWCPRLYIALPLTCRGLAFLFHRHFRMGILKMCVSGSGDNVVCPNLASQCLHRHLPCRRAGVFLYIFILTLACLQKTNIPFGAGNVSTCTILA